MGGTPQERFGAAAAGRLGTRAFRVRACRCRHGGGPCKCKALASFWHDVPLAFEDEGARAGCCAANFVCEIPKGTRAKMEVSTEETGNPIRQDATDAGRLRRYAWPMPWNYGMLPRTWEDPGRPAAAYEGLAAYPGDGDPVDVVEIGSSRCATGSVHRVRLLGALAMIDGGELDWKLVALREGDRDAAAIRSLADLRRERPGLIDEIKRWFRGYKVPDGKRPNKFALRGACVDPAPVVREAHLAYARAHGRRERSARPRAAEAAGTHVV